MKKGFTLADIFIVLIILAGLLIACLPMILNLKLKKSSIEGYTGNAAQAAVQDLNDGYSDVFAPDVQIQVVNVEEGSYRVFTTTRGGVFAVKIR